MDESLKIGYFQVTVKKTEIQHHSFFTVIRQCTSHVKLKIQVEKHN